MSETVARWRVLVVYGWLRGRRAWRSREINVTQHELETSDILPMAITYAIRRGGTVELGPDTRSYGGLPRRLS